MKVTILLADSVQTVEGKLYILGGGWNIIGPAPSPFALALVIEVDWNESNEEHDLLLELLDIDGRTVQIPTPAGDKPCTINSKFEVGRPPGLRPGTPLNIPIVINMGPIPLEPGKGYMWRCKINGHTEENWQVNFSTRPVRSTRQGAGASE